MLGMVDLGTAAASTVFIAGAYWAKEFFTSRNGKCQKPGEGEVCHKHGEEIAVVKAYQKMAAETMKRLEKKFDLLAAGKHIHPPGDSSD